MRFMRLLTALASLIPAQAFAAEPISGCGIVPGLPCAGGGAAGAVAIISTTFIPALQYIFYAVALAFFFYYAVRLMLESSDSGTIDETKNAYGYAITGAVIVSLMDNFIAAFGPGYATGTLVNEAPVNEAVNNIILFVRLIVAAVLTATIVYQGFRLIVLQGQDSEIEAQKKSFFYSLIGVAIIQLAFILVNSFLPGTGSSTLAREIVGITNFLLQLLGALAILAFIVAGIMIVLSTDEKLKDRAKAAMFTTVITLVLVLTSYVIIRFTIDVASEGTGTDITLATLLA